MVVMVYVKKIEPLHEKCENGIIFRITETLVVLFTHILDIIFQNNHMDIKRIKNFQNLVKAAMLLLTVLTTTGTWAQTTISTVSTEGDLTDAITDGANIQLTDDIVHNQTLKQGGRTYQLVTGGHDLNKGAGGDYIYLYYTKESFANGRKVTKLLVDMNEEGAEGKNGNNNPADLNSGVSTGTRPYLHVTATQDRGFITDVMLISGGPNTITNLRNTYLEQGWWVNYQDLNEDAGGPFINLLFKTDNETGSSNYITDFYIKKGSGHPNSLTHEGRTYYLTPGGGNDDFNSHGCDLNQGVGGDYLYLYYTKDAFSPARAINSIRFRPVSSESASINDNAKKGSLEANGEGEGCDLNSGAFYNNVTMSCKIFMIINIVPLDRLIHFAHNTGRRHGQCLDAC